ncbi:hypothetical protein AB833_09855 [Chromatiales bacterium (ex Bugula neritina AB1)]|nr:hypothetical protein AB833_09855 [Chromatiales bacterium (ex Bugula neritina AB1)]
MFTPRRIESGANWLDQDNVKIYTVSQSAEPISKERYFDRLDIVKNSKNVPWPSTAAFAIFHEANAGSYLILCWWGNGNELLTNASVNTGDGWTHNPDKYSFCIWDLEIMWAERNFFIELMYCENPDISEYRKRRLRS